MCLPEDKDHVERMRTHMRTQAKLLTGLEDTSGIEMLSMMRMVMNLYESIECERTGGGELSGPRMGLLLRLTAEEQAGNYQGITPTALSKSQQVNKNTISALLRGLEDQGLIQRTLDPEDRRLFRIQLTPAGREWVKVFFPKRMVFLNQIASGLNAEERLQLTALLAKLYRSLLTVTKTSKIDLNGG
jgi:DNA-binding MarR family transcriptional regulator